MIRVALLVTAAFLSLAGRAYSQTYFDGSTDLICSPTEASFCDEVGRCRQGSVGNFDLPRFITLKFSTGELTFKYSGDKEKIGDLDRFEDTGQRMIIHEVIDDRAAMIVIIKDTGRFLASGIRPKVNFFVGGFCDRY